MAKQTSSGCDRVSQGREQDLTGKIGKKKDGNKNESDKSCDFRLRHATPPRQDAATGRRDNDRHFLSPFQGFLFLGVSFVSRGCTSLALGYYMPPRWG